MPTIAQQLTQLESDRSDLVNNLETKGITGLTGNETFTELVPEVLNIPSGGADLSEYFVMDTAETNATRYIKNVPEDIILPTSMSAFFSGFYSLEKAPLFNTSNVTNFSATFRNCASLTEIPLLNTGSSTTFDQMFSGCTNLITIPLINTSNGTNFDYMFNGCTNLTSVSQINIQNATTMVSMFYNCSNLVTVPVLDTRNIEDGAVSSNLRGSFGGCTSLSNESLNNILQTCINATKTTKNKTLKSVGLSQAQATTCQSLSNWSSFVSHGWSTGY